jgi:hypothetical protein
MAKRTSFFVTVASLTTRPNAEGATGAQVTLEVLNGASRRSVPELPPESKAPVDVILIRFHANSARRWDL